MLNHETILIELEALKALHEEGVIRSTVMINLIKGEVSTSPADQAKKQAPVKAIMRRNKDVYKKAGSC